MKKVMLGLLALLLIGGCSRIHTVDYPQPEGKRADMTAYGLFSEHFHEFSYQQAVELLERKGTYIVYIGYPDCNFCQALVPFIDKTCEEKKMDIYYINAYPQEGEIDTENRDKLVEYLKGINSPDPDGNPTLWAPSIIYVQLGQVIGVHEGTVNTHDANERAMTEKEQARLEYMLAKQFDAMLERK
ncbi:MAG: hypothetical protein II704_01395 [Erysipelotrichaceae bacterium]|nr:hypothetical protein [Erysipelotrichaceae bacterium]